MQFREANVQDIDQLVRQRLAFAKIDAGHELYEKMKANLYLYFERAFDADTCDVVYAEDGEKCVGTGIIFYYDSVPSSFNPDGKNAYITSVFVEPEYRTQGIGSGILEWLIHKSQDRGYPVIMLNATDMGRPLYRKRGFTDIQNGMILDIRDEDSQ